MNTPQKAVPVVMECPPAPRKIQRHTVSAMEEDVPDGAHPDYVPTHESCKTCREGYGWVYSEREGYVRKDGSSPDPNTYLLPVRRKLDFDSEAYDEEMEEL